MNKVTVDLCACDESAHIPLDRLAHAGGGSSRRLSLCDRALQRGQHVRDGLRHASCGHDAPGFDLGEQPGSV